MNRKDISDPADLENELIKALATRNNLLQQRLMSLRDNERQMAALIDALYRELTEVPLAEPEREPREFDGISFVIAAYNMDAQLKRTLQSLADDYQKVDYSEMEVIIVDNGSTVPIRHEAMRRFTNVTEVIRVEGHPSPVFGLNRGIEAASFSNVAVMIDGAHMLSPGVFDNAKSVLQMMSRPVINVPQYILGAVSQNLISSDGAYQRESEKLAELRWKLNGYRLFEYAVRAGEVGGKTCHSTIESNCLITTKEVLTECGGFDESFDEAGAGLANIELMTRLRHHADNQYVILPGEGTFHQDHRGTTTGASREDREALVASYWEKYKAITGNTTNITVRPPFYYGVVSTAAERVPAISLDFGRARLHVMEKLAQVYAHRATNGQRGKIPELTLKSGAMEHALRPVLPPRGLIDSKAEAEGLKPGRLGYRGVLNRTHRMLKPKLYFEIGVDNGESLALANCQSIGVDPTCEVTTTLRAPTRIFRMESDTFFENEKRTQRLLKSGIDLSFIDGMHLAEFVVRDFINVERWVNENAVVVIDDVYPEQMEMAERDRRFGAWCGDVYKFILVLKEHRPDLNVHVFEAFVGPYRKGIAIITNLDRANTVLSENYDQIANDIAGGKYDITSIEDLETRLPSTSFGDFEEILSPYAAT